jgi:hypothetical protein
MGIFSFKFARSPLSNLQAPEDKKPALETLQVSKTCEVLC